MNSIIGSQFTLNSHSMLPFNQFYHIWVDIFTTAIGYHLSSEWLDVGFYVILCIRQTEFTEFYSDFLKLYH